MHSRAFLILLFLVGFISLTFAQGFQDPFRFPEQSYIGGGLGVTWIDGQPFTTFTIAPDIAIGKFGVGVYLQLLFDRNNDWKLRTLEYENGAGIFRAIRYIRYGQKYDPLFLLVGSVERATLAHGFLVWNYNNVSNYDQRKIGLIADVDLDKLGIETVWSSVGRNDMRGFNFYFRPLRLFNNATPVLNTLRFYGTYVRDSNVKSGALLDSTAALTAYGIGADLQWLNIAALHSTIYADYSKIDDYGDGKALGIDFVFPNFIGIFGLSARFEKRFIGKQFVPSLFGPLHELNRESGLFTYIENSPKVEGYFGELAGHILNRILLLGSYQDLNGIANSGVLHLEASAPTLIPRIELRGYYDKTGIETFEDARTLDTNSILTAEASYQIYLFLYFSAIYRWYWQEDQDDPGVYNPVERFEPRVTLRYNF